VALVQFSGDLEDASECHQIVTLDRQWDSLEEIRSLTRISQDVGQSAAQFGKECDAGCVDGTEGPQSQWLKMWELGRDEYFADFLAAACSAAPPGLAEIEI